ncbi:MAG: 6,7-dimethyl-8-ribityllumazine synthase [Alistipes sp.]|nr:6,7-dimethyl-8-ribityllumazine synthase [Alistipes sp.]
MKTKQRKEVEGRTGNLRIGIVATAGDEQRIGEAVALLRTLGCTDEDMVVHKVPGEMELVLGARFFAEYTDVDGLLVLSNVDPNTTTALAATVIQGVNMISIDWNFPIIISSSYPSMAEAAAALLQMIGLQILLEPTMPIIAPDTNDISLS